MKDGLIEEFYDNGQLWVREYFKEGELDGPWVEYWEDGQLCVSGNYKSGVREGLWEFYYDNGQLRSRGEFKEGEFDGPWEGYYENGRLRSRENYKYKKGEDMSVATLSKFTVPLASDQSASSQGLLMPKLQYRFRFIKFK